LRRDEDLAALRTDDTRCALRGLCGMIPARAGIIAMRRFAASISGHILFYSVTSLSVNTKEKPHEIDSAQAGEKH
jgi:hypothetical protein